MKSSVKYGFWFFSFFYIAYLAIPSPLFPNKSVDASRSGEPADLEDPLRRAYFTNMDRNEVLNYYQRQFDEYATFSFEMPSYRLNYPPENAQTIIRDQTRSTYLEEVVHPFRESLFVNGFEPKSEKDAIIINETAWKQKIIVKYNPSNAWVRFIIGLMTIGLITLLYEATFNLISTMKHEK